MKNRRLAELAGLIHRSTTEEPKPLNESARLLLEEEEEGGGDDEGGGEGLDLFGGEGGDDAGDDAGGDDAGDEGDEEKGDEDAEEEAEPEVEPAETLKTKDIAKYGPGEIDKEIDSVITNIFSDSTMRAKDQSKTSLGYPGAAELDLEESFNKSMKNKSLDFLMEDSKEPAYEQIDIGHFTSEVARYINNYQNLLDIEGMLFNKARQFLLNQIGKEAEGEFVELLATKFGLDFKEDFTETSPAFNPTAVGATGGSGA